MRFARPAAALLALLTLADRPVRAEGPSPPATTVLLVRPDQQAEVVIGLFRGAKAPHPAAALAAWKRASREPYRLGKPLEAVIAAVNPLMVGELRRFDGAEVGFWTAEAGPRLVWGTVLPHEDGAVAALGSASVLTDGAADDPLAGLAVDRLGRAGSPLMAVSPRGLLLGGTRAGLASALERSQQAVLRDEPPGLHVHATADLLRAARSIAERRLAELARGLQALDGFVFAEGGALRVGFDCRFADPAGLGLGLLSVDPAWLDEIPTDGTVGAFALALRPDPKGWDATFALADRVERVDPARRDLAPIRLRLDLLARTVGVRLEADLWPHLVGVVGWIGSDGGTAIDRAWLGLHLDDEAAAGRFAARLALPGNPAPNPPAAGAVRLLGRVGNQPLQVARVGSVVRLGWGDGVLAAAERSRTRPDSSAGPALRRAWGDRKPALAGGVWPGRMPGLLERGSPLGPSLEMAGPLTWIGFGDGDGDGRGKLRVEWPNLDGAVRRFLDLIPLDPPPDH